MREERERERERGRERERERERERLNYFHEKLDKKEHNTKSKNVKVKKEIFTMSVEDRLAEKISTKLCLK